MCVRASMLALGRSCHSFSDILRNARTFVRYLPNEDLARVFLPGCDVIVRAGGGKRVCGVGEGSREKGCRRERGVGTLFGGNGGGG